MDASRAGLPLFVGPFVSLLLSCSSAEPPLPSDGGSKADSGADSGGASVTPPLPGQRHDTLSEWNLFSDPRAQTPNDGVIPYTVNSQLFSDYTAKRRFLYVPDGATIRYDAEGAWHFPVGTVLVKTFSYPDDLRNPGGTERLLETRLLVLENEDEGFAPYTYVFDEGQTEAQRKSAGSVLPVSFIGLDGQNVDNDYVVPNSNECRECHGEAPAVLGGRTRQLERDHDYGSGPENQIDFLAARGLFETPPPQGERQALSDPTSDAPLEDRFRAYADANCGHCHRPGRSGDSGSGLHLDYASTAPETRTHGSIGICKVPTSAGGATCGHTFDIVPGDPDHSIMICRMASEQNQIMMPPVGRNLVHTEGLSLMREWITSLEGSCE